MWINWVPRSSDVYRGACANVAAFTGSIWSSFLEWRARPDYISICLVFWGFFSPPHHWVSLSSSAALLPLLWHSFCFLASPFNVQSRHWQVDYNVPKFWSNRHDKLSLYGYLGALTRFHVLMNETNAASNSRYVEQTAWLMCLFGVSQSLMAELSQIRPLVPFCCQHNCSHRVNSVLTPSPTAPPCLGDCGFLSRLKWPIPHANAE